MTAAEDVVIATAPGTVLTPGMIRLIREQPLGYVATVSPDGAPSLSPKGTFVVVSPATIAFGEIRSPGTLRNLAANPAVEVNFVDPFTRRGCRVSGAARAVRPGDLGFDTLAALAKDHGALARRIRAFVQISVARALPLSSPAYDDGATEDELRRLWTDRFRRLQPGERFAD